MRYRNVTRFVVHGVTLLELMVAISVIAILATIAIPTLQNFIQNNRVTAQTNELVAIINLARNEAIRRNLDLLGAEDVVLRLDANGDRWAGNVVVTAGDTDPDCPIGVIRCIENERVRLAPNTAEIRFDSRGYLAGFTETVLCLRHADPCSGDRQHRVLRIRPSGRVESEETLACDAACPGS